MPRPDHHRWSSQILDRLVSPKSTDRKWCDESDVLADMRAWTRTRPPVSSATEPSLIVLSPGSSHGSPDREAELIATFVSRRVDGLVVVPSPAAVDILTSEVTRGTSVVCVDLSPEGLTTDVILTDHLIGADMATHPLTFVPQRSQSV